jgi:hypothetical protein
VAGSGSTGTPRRAWPRKRRDASTRSASDAFISATRRTLRPDHELPVAQPKRLQLTLAPAAHQDFGRSRFTLQEREQGNALDVIGNRQAGRVEHGREHVDQAHQRILSTPAKPLTPIPREADHERHVEQLLVELLVQELAVLHELVTVIREEDDQRVLQEPRAFQLTEKARKLIIGAADSSVVQVPQVL